MSSTKWNSELRDLFRSTQARFPHQKLEPETIKAFLEDWRDWCDTVGIHRFTDGVKRARSCTDFFPSINQIKHLTPEPRSDNADFSREMADLRRRQAAGEKFYTLGDCLLEFANQVISGKIKGADGRRQKLLEKWAIKLQADHKKFAEKMIADSDKKRSKSDFMSIEKVIG